MFEVYKETPNYESFAYYAVDEEKQIKAMLSGVIETVKPGFLSSLSKRAVMMQAPIFDEIDALDFLLSEYSKIMKHKVVYSEVRNHYDPECMSRTMLKNGFKYEDHLNIIVDLSQTEDILWQQIHSKRRNEIRKAEKNRVIVKRLTDEYISESYSIIKEVYDRAKLPLPSILFFENSLQYSTQNMGMGMYGAFLNDDLIGIMFTLQYKNIVYDLYAGSKSKYYDKNPNDIIPWKVFNICKNEGKTIFDFGGAGKPNVPYGVRDYKMKFGGKLVNYGRFTLVHNPIKMKLAETGFKIYQKVRL
jgi:lipid II:glycine glycyltransferase (peptidoglycan interpeptide bridge formation enzyme)